MASTSAGSSAFPTTRWTLILSARESPEARRAALDELLASYWRPLYAFARQKGLDQNRAEDAVQGFVVHLLEQDFLERLDPARGRLRSYLRTAMHHYLINQHDKACAKKRGGDVTTLSSDVASVERTLAGSHASPEDVFDREWALMLMERALSRLRSEFESGKRQAQFEVIQAFFSVAESSEPPSYQDVALQHSMTIPQVKSLLHRSRVRFRELVTAEALETVAAPGDAADEVRSLLGHLSR